MAAIVAGVAALTALIVAREVAPAQRPPALRPSLPISSLASDFASAPGNYLHRSRPPSEMVHVPLPSRDKP